jgi:hypothetical protein
MWLLLSRDAKQLIDGRDIFCGRMRSPERVGGRGYFLVPAQLSQTPDPGRGAGGGE